MKTSTRKPDFFIPGAPRCGTTSMFAYLRQQPDIFIPEAKELNFFGSDLHHVGPPRAYKGRSTTLEEYLSHFTRANRKMRIGEASVSYFFSMRAAQEIKEFNPAARMIVMLRAPVEMIYSKYRYNRFLGVEDIVDLGEALNAEENRKGGAALPSKAHLLEGLFYRDIAKLAENVGRYLDAFGPQNVLIIIYDDFAKDTARVYRRTLRFLGVNEDFQPDFRVVNPNRHVRSECAKKFIKVPPQAARSLVRRLLPASLQKPMVRWAWRLVSTQRPRPPMDPRLRQQLKAEFAPEVERLGALIGRHLSHWCGGRDHAGETDPLASAAADGGCSR